jgi:hypothetical protein
MPREGGEVMTYALASQQVSWSDVHEFAEPRLRQVGDWPPIGTLAWCLLGETDPGKWAAILDAAQHWALRVECSQATRAEASRHVSEAGDWSAIATKMVQRNGAYIPQSAT